MKQKFNFFIVFFTALSITYAVHGEEFTKKLSKSWPAAGIETLRISNKFGEVKIQNTGGTSVTVDVVITVEGSENRAKNKLDNISVEFGQQGNTATAETHISEGFKSGNFTIDYTVNIPSEKNLDITNKFGNVIIDKLTGKANLDVSYGNLTAVDLTGPSTDFDLAYGKAEIQTLGNATVSLAYSRLELETGAVLKLDSKYSSMNADKLDELALESKYDSFNFGEMNRLTGVSKFTSYKIARLNKLLKLESGYGGIKVDRIPAGFELIDVVSSYAQVSLGIEENAGYQVEAKCDYCKISYPEIQFKGNRMSENTSEKIEGKVASGSPGKVVVTSRYGNIRLTK
jgi:hypothetical protein